MLFFLLALWRESWLAVVEPSAERLRTETGKQEVKSTHGADLGDSSLAK